MTKKAAAAKKTRINRTTQAPVTDLERYCRGLNDWPRSWRDHPGCERNLFFEREKDRTDSLRCD